VYANGQVFGNHRTTAGAFLRCASGIYEQTRSTSFCRFVLRVLHELSPGHVRNALIDGAIPVLLHPLNIQVLKNDQAITVHKPARLLVRKVVASVSLTLVSMLQSANSLLALRTTLSQPFLLTLKSGAVFSIPLYPPLALNLLTVRQRGKRGQAQVNTNHFGGDRQQLDLGLTREAGVPITDATPSNGQGLGPSLDGPAQFDFDRADLGETQTAIVDISKLSCYDGEELGGQILGQV